MLENKRETYAQYWVREDLDEEEEEDITHLFPNARTYGHK